MNKKSEKYRTVEDYLFYIGNGIIMAIVIFWPWFLRHMNDLPWGCLLNRMTGFYCPGCGGTRAFNAMIHGHWLLSLKFNPVVLYFFLMFAWFMVSWYIQKLSRNRIKIGMLYRNVYVYIGIIILMLNCIIKNIGVLMA